MAAIRPLPGARPSRSATRQARNVGDVGHEGVDHPLLIGRAQRLTNELLGQIDGGPGHLAPQPRLGLLDLLVEDEAGLFADPLGALLGHRHEARLLGLGLCFDPLANRFDSCSSAASRVSCCASRASASARAVAAAARSAFICWWRASSALRIAPRPARNRTKRSTLKLSS